MRALTFELASVTSAVEPLCPSARIAFAAYWAQRLHPAYVAFADITGFGYPPFLQGCLDVAWSAAEGAESDLRQVEDRQHRLVHDAPEIDNPPVLAYAAMEAFASAWDALDVVAAGSLKSTASACTGFANVVDHYLMERDHRGEWMATNQADPFRLRNDPIWQPELERLNRVVSDLTGPPPSVAAVRQVRAMAEGTSGNLVERMLVLSRMIRPA